jgi:hypothetical protein
MRFFFYGTLLDADIRAIVFPHLIDTLEVRGAELPGFRRVAAKDGPYPVLRPDPTAKVTGALAEGVDLPGLARAAHFEGARYRPALRRITDARGAALEAWLFLPETYRLASRRGWDLGRWQRRQKRHMLMAAKAWMSEFGAKGFSGGDLSWQGRRTLRRLAAELEGGPVGDEVFQIDEAA